MIVVGLNGYNYKGYKRDARYSSTKDLNIHIASAGPIQLTFKEWDEFKAVVEEARNFLLDKQAEKYLPNLGDRIK